MNKASTVILGAAAIFLLAEPAPAQAASKPSGWGATVVLEPLLLAHGGFTALCNPRATVRSGWGVERIERRSKGFLLKAQLHLILVKC